MTTTTEDGGFLPVASVETALPEGTKNYMRVKIVNSKVQFGVYSLETLLVSDDADAPSYFAGLVLADASSDSFELITSASGELWVKNNSGRDLTMSGTVTYQEQQGSGGSAEWVIWSEKTTDDGVTFTENPFSLRTNEINNNNDASETKSSFVGDWEDGSAIRWALYKVSGGVVTLAPPSVTVNNGNTVSGLTLYWQLNEV